MEEPRKAGKDCRVCRFSNVCLNRTSLKIQFYKGSDNSPLFYNAKGAPVHSFPADFTDTGTQVYPSAGRSCSHFCLVTACLGASECCRLELVYDLCLDDCRAQNNSTQTHELGSDRYEFCNTRSC